MARPLKKLRTASVPSSPLSCLPDEIVLDCLVRVPRHDYNNVSSVSKRLRSLVRSPELYRLRSLLPKKSVYVCLCDTKKYYSSDPTFLWFNLRRTTKTKTEYELVPIPLPSRFFMYSCATVAVDSEIYFIGGYPKPTELWILDTRSGKLRQGPTMRKTRFAERSAVGVVDRKIYVIQELKNGSIEEEVFDLESQAWKVPGVPVPDGKVHWRTMMRSSVTLEGKVYAMEREGGRSITVYNLRQGRRKEKMEIPIDAQVWQICVVDNLLFALFSNCGLACQVSKCGLAWLDTRRNVWRMLSGNAQKLRSLLYGNAMVEYDGKLAVFWREILTSTSIKKEKIWCAVITLCRVREEVFGTVEWIGVVATIPFVSHYLHCLVASD